MKLSPQKLNVRKSFKQDLLESAPKRWGESPVIPQRKVKVDETKPLGKGGTAGRRMLCGKSSR